jgi:hypothetical protein
VRQLVKQDDCYKVIEFPIFLFEYLYSKYLPSTSLVIQDNIDPTAADINQLITDDITHVIFDYAHNAVDVDRQLAIIEKLDLTRPWYIISGLFKYHCDPPTDPRIKFFPFWAVWMSRPHAPAWPMQHHYFSDQPKRYPVSCLNGTFKNHRTLTYLLLKDRPWFKDMVFTFGNRAYFDDHVSEWQLTPKELAEFRQLDRDVKFIDTDTTIGIDVTVNHPAFQSSYINLVTETGIEPSRPMLSEKTFKPIVAGQLFVLVSAPGSVQFLRDIGIDTFDDVVDHSYDTIQDPRTRITSAVGQIDRLVQMDLDQLYQILRPRLEHNSEYFLSPEFRNQFVLNFG